MSEYLSGDQLYRFLHISKRKMKYLLENGYIPVIDTGKKTYRYRVKRCDAERFKEKMETEENFLKELKGLFSSRTPTAKAVKTYIISEARREKFKKYLTQQWQFYPDALPAKQAAHLTEITPQRINELVRKGKLYGICVGNIQYISKDQLIEYIAQNSPLATSQKSLYKKRTAHKTP